MRQSKPIIDTMDSSKNHKHLRVHTGDIPHQFAHGPGIECHVFELVDRLVRPRRDSVDAVVGGDLDSVFSEDCDDWDDDHGDAVEEMEEEERRALIELEETLLELFPLEEDFRAAPLPLIERSELQEGGRRLRGELPGWVRRVEEELGCLELEPELELGLWCGMREVKAPGVKGVAKARPSEKKACGLEGSEDVTIIAGGVERTLSVQSFRNFVFSPSLKMPSVGHGRCGLRLNYREAR